MKDKNLIFLILIFFYLYTNLHKKDSSFQLHFFVMSNFECMYYEGEKINQSFFPKISIIIPCYQKSKYLFKAFKSCIEDQQLKKYQFTIEIICIDDYSTDDTLEKLYEIKKKYEQFDINDNFSQKFFYKSNCFIKIFHFREHKGTLYARLFAIHQSRANYIMSLDADDEFVPGIMQRLLLLIKNHKYIDIIQFRLLNLHLGRELKIMNNSCTFSDYKYDIFSYGNYPFSITHTLNLHQSFVNYKFFYLFDINKSTVLEKAINSRFINAKLLKQMCLSFNVMWNLAGLFVKRDLMMKATYRICNYFKDKKITTWEDQLIAYTSFYFCNVFYFLDEVGYIYHIGTTRVKTFNQHEMIIAFLKNLFSSNLSKS